MKLNYIFAFCLGLGLAYSPLAMAQKKAEKVEKYVVQAGETFLGIAHRHSTTLDHLRNLNPDVQPDHLEVGQVLVVPFVPGGAEPAPTPEQRAAAAAKKAATQNGGATSATQPIQVPSNVSTVQINKPKPQPIITYKNYKVKKKETVYSIAKANGITVEELAEANPEMKQPDYKLKKGTTLRIPVKTYPPQPKYASLSNVNVAVVLPLKGNGVEYERSVEFYRGLLMGIEELKAAGTNVTVSVYNEPAPDVSIAQTMLQVMLNKPHMVIGPLYPSHFTDVTAVSGKQTKVVIPFSSKVPQVDYRPDVFVVNTPANYENTLAVDLFMTSFKKQTTMVLLHSTNGSKRAFSEELQRRLSSAGYDVVSMSAAATAQQMATTLNAKKRGECIVIPDDATEATMQQMLKKVTALQQAMPTAQVSLLGYDTWLKKTEQADRKQVHDADTYILTTNYYYPYTTASKAFNANYQRWFKTDFVKCSPRMAPLGYDMARSMIGGLATFGFDYNTQQPLEGSVAAQPKLQTDLRFITVGGNGGYVSRSMWLVHFKKDMSIVKISAQ